jgi:hypothetical protein
MIKKIVSIIIAVAAVFALSFAAYAAPDEDGDLLDGKSSIEAETNSVEDLPEIVIDLMTGEDIEDTEQFLLEITKPAKSTDSVYGKSYIIGGNPKYGDIRVAFAIYDKIKEEYMPFYNTDSDNWIDLGAYSGLSTEVELKESENKIRIVAYRRSETYTLTKDMVQVSNLTIKRLSDSIRIKVIDAEILLDDISTPRGPLRK